MPQPGRVMFLVDGGPEVGGGHAMRCLALAAALRARGAACAMFQARIVAEQVVEVFAGAGIERLTTDETTPPAVAREAVVAAGGWNADVIVVDHYRLGSHHERALRGPGREVVVIDDLADRPHDCDLLIDPTIGREGGAYQALVPGAARLLLGPDYALLRPGFAAARADTLARRSPGAAPSRLLVSLGLMDHLGITGRVLHLLEPVLSELQVDIAVGGAATSLTWLEHRAARNPNLTLHVDARDMAGLIAQADIGVGAGGASTWERSSLGLPSASLVLADNQEPVARELDRRGATIAVDARARSFSEALPAALERLMTDAQLRESLSRTSAALCDGRGAERVADAILALTA